VSGGGGKANLERLRDDEARIFFFVCWCARTAGMWETLAARNCGISDISRIIVRAVVALTGWSLRAERCGAVRCGAVQCDVIRCDVMRCDAMRCDAGYAVQTVTFSQSCGLCRLSRGVLRMVEQAQYECGAATCMRGGGRPRDVGRRVWERRGRGWWKFPPLELILNLGQDVGFGSALVVELTSWASRMQRTLR
jgi:hypothetical protein